MKKSNHLAIGAFVVFAFFLFLIALLLFGSGNLLETNILYSMSFDKSVNGLNKGAPVMFRGIKIGEVTDIRLSFDNNDCTPPEGASRVSWPIHVTVKLFPNSVAFAENRNTSWWQKLLQRFSPDKSRDTMKNWLSEMVLKRGLRAQLQTQNFLTGLLYIELDLFHEETATEAVREQLAAQIIPTRISAFERLYLSLNQNDFTSQVNQMYEVVSVIGHFFTEGKAQRVLDNLVSVSASMDQTLANVNAIVSDFRGPSPEAFRQNASELIASLNNSAKALEAILSKLNQQRTDDMLNHANAILANANQAISQLRNYIDPKSPMGKLIPITTASLCGALDGATKTFAKLQETIDLLQKQLPQVITNTNNSLTTIQDATGRIAPQISDTLADARKLIGTADQTVQDFREPLNAVIAKLNTTLANLEKAAEDSAQLVANAKDTISPDAPVMQNLNKAIEDARQAAQSIRALADLLTNQPEALIRGRR